MEKKHFSSYAERVRNAKEQAKKAQKKERKGKFTKSQWVTFILMIVWTIASILGVWGFSRTFDSKGSKMQVIGASAAEIDDDFIPSYDKDGKFVVPLTGLQGLTFVVNTPYEAVLMTPFYLFVDLEAGGYYVKYYNSSAFVLQQWLTFNNSAVSVSIPFKTNSSVNIGMLSVSFTSYDETENFSTVDLSAIPTNITYSMPAYNVIRTWVEFKDDNEQVYDLFFDITFGTNLLPSSNNTTVALPFFNKTWNYGTGGVFTDSYNSTYSHEPKAITYSEFFAAYDEGFRYALEDLRKAIENAYENGKAVGYEEGINEANVYSFGNLLSSVIDVPINAFRSLLNFEILGVNLLAFAEGLITIALLLALVKLLI